MLESCALLARLLLRHGWFLATAESCTGGLIAAPCTDLAGSSNWFERGFVTYSNAAKCELLGVDAALIDRHGAVSERGRARHGRRCAGALARAGGCRGDRRGRPRGWQRGQTGGHRVAGLGDTDGRDQRREAF